MPLNLPDGFSIEIFAKDLPGARVMAFDKPGNMWVSQTGDGKISQLIIQNGKVADQQTAFRNLQKPHGLAFDLKDQSRLYFAEENKVSAATLNDNPVLRKLIDLPAGGGHFTRTLSFGPDKRLYVSIGSSCNVCNEGDLRRAAIYSMNSDGSDFKLFAKGLRNTLFFAWDEEGRMWGTDMGRDYLGDNLPPDEINIIEQGRDYGWPFCFGKQAHDDNYDDDNNRSCSQTQAAQIELPAHSAPLGLAFIPKGFGPADWEGDLIVALHGSWNRSEPTGYKLIRVKLDDQGNFERFEDFITGWLQGSTALGRPVDVLIRVDGNAMYVSDDKAGMIYKISYKL